MENSIHFKGMKGGNKRPNLLLEGANQMAATQLIIFNKNTVKILILIYLV